MSIFGECNGYTGKPCPSCGRYRLERYANGNEVCEKCNWCPQLNRYVEDDELFPDEEDYHNA